MKTAAIIAEFNPFHNGHKYLLDTAKKEYGIDYCIAIMSGDYVQRGDVAIVSKHQRAEMAIKAGFSAVFELPLLYATSSAPDFAYGGVCIADALHVDYLIFGSESGDLDTLVNLADSLSASDDELNSYINENVREGMSYAKAVSEALKTAGICQGDFSSPNDILAIEYIKALKQLNSAITPIAIKRSGAAHDSADIVDGIASATRIRNLISLGEAAESFIPEPTQFTPLFISDFYDMLSYRLHFISDEELCNTPGISKDLSNKIKKVSSASDYRALIDSCKSKNFSESTIRRAFIHILLGLQINNTFFPNGHILKPASVRLLAANKNDSSIIKHFKEYESLTIYTKPKEIIANNDLLLLLDMKSSDLYEKVYSTKYQKGFISDCQKSPKII